MKEGFESYPVPQQAPARVGEPWPHPMMQQQQQPGMLENKANLILMFLICPCKM